MHKKRFSNLKFTPSERSRNNKSAFLELVREYFDLENLALQLLQTVEHLQYRDKDRIPDLNDYKFLVPLFSFKTRTLTKLENSIKEKSVITAHAASSSSHTTPLVDTDSDELRLKYVQNDTKIAYKYHKPGSKAWLGYLKSEFYNDNP
uniref:Uncharacterized protein n=1 Tax=Rhizophagus irregularis (strain DAOM 181602 / DAOM 197198 / MUCL 43194) TaxID=747089 RepID=U9U7Z2_RHIID